MTQDVSCLVVGPEGDAKSMRNPPIDIVLAQESKPNPPLWLDRVPKDVYNIPKTNPDDPHSIVYLSYIVENYDTLPDYVLFLKADPLQTSPITPNAFIHAIMKEPCLLLDKTYWLQSLKCLGDGTPHHPGLEIAKWYKKILNTTETPQVFEFTAGSQFLVTKTRITARPKAFWQTLLTYVKSDGLDGATLERLWGYVF
jgi:hypothetical protein